MDATWWFEESTSRGIDLILEPEWPGFNEALADSVSSLAPRGSRETGLSTYWIDLLTFRLEHWSDEPGVEQVLVWGNATELVKVDDAIIARSLYELFDEERMPVSALLPALKAWRELVLARGGDFVIPETYRRNPIPSSPPQSPDQPPAM